tara:strand:- start:16042 stop:18978 length:2937 start_codon:yes stop_codon:yes gene_type:complete
MENEVTMKNTKYADGSLPATRKFIANSISIALLTGVTFASIPTFAQEQVSDKDEEAKEEQTEIIEVYGMRSSLRSAIDRKKEAGTATDSIVAEDISEFPDKNIGEALQRVTGVQLGREFGEGTAVSIRGVEPQLVNVEVNGVAAVGASDPFAGSGRSVDFASMSSELVKALDVIKGSEARLTEGGIGGTIKVITRKPNDFEENFLQVSAENQYNDLTEINNQKYNFTGVYKFSDDVGAMLNLTTQDRATAFHALRNTEWVRQADYDGSLEKTFVDEDYADITAVSDCPDSACEAQWYDFRARIPRNSVWSRDEDRISANAMFQYRISTDLSTYFGVTYTERDFTQVDTNLQLEVPSESHLYEDSFTVGDNHNASSFLTRDATIVNRSINNDWNLKTAIYDAGFDYSNDLFSVSGVLGYTKQTQNIYQIESRVNANRVENVLVEFADNGAPIYDLNTGNNRADVDQMFDANSADSYWFYSRIYDKPIAQDNDQLMGKLDFTYYIPEGFFSKVRSGVRVSSEYQDHELLDRRITRIAGNEYGGTEWTLEDQASLIDANSYTVDNYFGNYDPGVPVIDSWLALKPLEFYNGFMDIHGDNISDAEKAFTQAGYYEVEMDSQAFYVQADFESEIGDIPYWGNMGMRYVRTQVDTTGNAIVQVQVDVVDGDPDQGNMIDPDHPEAFNDQTTLSNDYNELLPSVNVNFGLIPDELILYFGAAKVMAHPKAKDLNISASCTLRLDALSQQEGRPNTCTAGNPRLQPYVAKQLDVALNWYPNEDSMLSGAYFTKKMDSWILDAIETFDQDFFGDGNLYDVRQKINGSGVTTNGIELAGSTFFSMLPAPFNNMGINANYTYMTSEDVGLFNQLTGEELDFPSQSQNSYNITWFYETPQVSVKFAYNYRDSYLQAPADRGGNPVYVDDAGFLDAKVVYRPQDGMLENFKFHFDVRNLLKEGNIYVNGPGRISDIRYSGREFSVGFTYKI